MTQVNAGIPQTRQSLLVHVRDAGNRRAWSEFEGIYGPAVYRFARRRGLQSADAEDLTQQVMLTVAAKMPDWTASTAAGSFRAWLLTVARNAITNKLTRRRPDTAKGGDDNQQTPELADSGHDDAAIDWEFRRAMYRRAASDVQSEFKDNTWLSFRMTAVEGQTPEAVADELGLTIGAVYTNKCRVLKRIRSRVEEIEPESLSEVQS